MKSSHGFRISICAVLLLAPLATLSAQVADGLYATIGYGVALPADTSFTINNVPAAEDADPTELRTGTLKTDLGWVGFRAGAGYSISGFRPEISFSYRQLPVSEVSYSKFCDPELAALGLADGCLPEAILENMKVTVDTEQSSVTDLGLLANVSYDIDTGTPIVPYLGIGLGASSITAKVEVEVQLDLSSLGGPPIKRTLEREASQWALAYQATAGVGYALTEALTIGLGYRLAGGTEAEFDWNTVEDEVIEKLKAAALTHNIELGVVFRF